MRLTLKTFIYYSHFKFTVQLVTFSLLNNFLVQGNSRRNFLPIKYKECFINQIAIKSSFFEYFFLKKYIIFIIKPYS